MNVLLIVDVQNDFCPGGALAVPGGDAVIPVINQLSPNFDLVIATKDWHPPNHVSFSENNPGTAVFDTISLYGGVQQTLWPVHCVKGTPGAEFHPDLRIEPVNLILHKGTHTKLDSYSAFFENDGITATGLESYLKGLGAQTIHVCGLAEDVCVFFTAIDAKKRGFATVVISDATAAVDMPKGSAERSRAERTAEGITSMTARETADQLGFTFA